MTTISSLFGRRWWCLQQIARVESEWDDGFIARWTTIEGINKWSVKKSLIICHLSLGLVYSILPLISVNKEKRLTRGKNHQAMKEKSINDSHCSGWRFFQWVNEKCNRMKKDLLKVHVRCWVMTDIRIDASFEMTNLMFILWVSIDCWSIDI